MQRNDRQREKELLLRQVSHADPMVRREEGLEPLGRALGFRGVGHQDHSAAALHGPHERSETSLAGELGLRRDLHVRDGHALLTAETHPPRHAAIRARELRPKSWKIGDRDREVDADSPVGQRVDVTRLRPVLRHGARMIGSDSSQVKALVLA